MIEAGCEIVRLTAPSKRDAENLEDIKNRLRKAGYDTPLVADIHFTPNAAEIAANIVEKVRINPGNFADKKKFEELDYTDESYQAELDRIEEKFTPLVLQCKANNVAMRIGTNHGSLSDRILSRYGDTPEGMVESAMEFLRICVKHDYHNIVLSMKASNTLVMVQAYRLLVATMKDNNMNYPLHLGVTEAGDGEDGRIKSAVGIGALLEDGIGDTIRVSLTEEPEEEIPVARKLIAKYNPENINVFNAEASIDKLPFDPYHYSRRISTQIKNVGGKNHPIVIGDLSHIDKLKPSHLFGFGYQYSVPLDKWSFTDAAVDYIFIGDNSPDFELPGTLKAICSYDLWAEKYKSNDQFIPIGNSNNFTEETPTMYFLEHDLTDSSVEYLVEHPKAVIVAHTEHTNRPHLFRLFWLNLAKNNINNPIVLCSQQNTDDAETFQLWTSSDLGGVLIDGFGDGVWLKGNQPSQLINSTSFGILQATRTRISKTEYISCPSCGRTLFNLQDTTAKIRSKTSHLKGIKIGIMGCIVNGPGEMADADYGYVGTGPGKIHLYKEKEVVRKNVPEEDAVDALIDLIKENGDWTDPKV
jgi:(E)-4-hydroxy-3-methylbut-2-enyl-diphosphate synthase